MREENTTPERIYIHHANQIKVDGTQCLVFTSAAPKAMQDSQTAYTRSDLSPSVKPLEWQPIETAPKDGSRFWAYEKGAGPDSYECWWQNDFGHWEGWQTDWDNEPDPTHWMPLPASPSDQPTQSDKDKEIERLREALIEIERVYYNEGENVKRRAARMRALASEALEERG